MILHMQVPEAVFAIDYHIVWLAPSKALLSLTNKWLVLITGQWCHNDIVFIQLHGVFPCYNILSFRRLFVSKYAVHSVGSGVYCSLGWYMQTLLHDTLQLQRLRCANIWHMALL